MVEASSSSNRRNTGAGHQQSHQLPSSSPNSLKKTASPQMGKPTVGIKEVFVDKRYTDALRKEVDR